MISSPDAATASGCVASRQSCSSVSVSICVTAWKAKFPEDSAHAYKLMEKMPGALEDMQGGDENTAPVAPVDMAQAIIGPGMEIYSKYKAVLNADGSPKLKYFLLEGEGTADQYNIAFPKGSALVELVNGVLTELQEDGTLDTLIKQWLY